MADYSSWAKGWTDRTGSFYDHLANLWHIYFYYDGKEYGIECTGIDDPDNGYYLVDYDSNTLHYEPTLADFMEKGFMGKPIQPVIDESIILDIC